MDYINPNRIIGADILEPYTNSGETCDFGNTRGWQVSLLIGYIDDSRDLILVSKESKEDCIKLIESLGLSAL